MPEIPYADWDSVQAPGAVLTRQGRLPLDPECRTCQPDLDGALAGYWTPALVTSRTSGNRPAEVLEAAGDLRELYAMTPRVSVLEAAWSPLLWGESNGGSPHSRWELGWTFRGLVPDSEMVMRDDRDRILLVEGEKEGEERRFLRQGRRTLASSWAVAAHHESHGEFDAWGSGLLINLYSSIGRKPWTVYTILEPGYALYRNEARDAWRWRASGRVGMGYGLAFFEVGVERGFALDATGDGHREWRYFAGPRVRLSTSWLKKLGG